MTLVGVIVIILVVSWQLFARLGAAQSMVDDLSPAFTVDRVDGARGGIDMVSAATDTGDPMMHPDGAAAEVPKLVDFIAVRTGSSPEAAQRLLAQGFPAINGFLTSLPLPEVSAELPKLVHYLSTVLEQTPAQTDQMLQTDYPKIWQVYQNLPKLTAGWDAIPGTEHLTRFDGTPVRTMPQLRTYLSQEVVAPVERQQTDFRPLGIRGGVGFLAPLLLALGSAVIAFGTTMMIKTRRGVSTGPLRFAWAFVSVIGVVVIGLVLALNLFPRLIGGQALLDDTRPVFALDRIQGDHAGVEFISIFVDALGPAVLPDGGVTQEYPALLNHVAQHVGIPLQDVRDLVHLDFPHAARLLDGVPFSASTADATKLIYVLASTSHVTPEQVLQDMKAQLPQTYQLITSLKTVTDGWTEVPGTVKLTHFDGTPSRSVPLIRDYFRNDVIPGLERQQANFVIIDTNWPQLIIFAPLLCALGAAVFAYGFLIRSLTRKQLRRQRDPQNPLALAPNPPVPVEVS
ncbi:hypothetical protein D8S82_22530 [Mycobacterium hodleri]|uniref:Uncharacterized protein n=1 Tax=Mycolicibacterium hodleri TaxID=49897 RepID=A0A544VWJ3_9MYCO|nr:hypothetical protein D8S82_22530 [Mycolicibacterium hodleri]